MNCRVEYPNGSVLITDSLDHAIKSAGLHGGVVTVAEPVTGTATVFDDFCDPELARQAELDRAWDEYVDWYNGKRYEENQCEYL
jgi:hypothetical protein